MGELQALSSCTLRSSPSVSKARNLGSACVSFRNVEDHLRPRVGTVGPVLFLASKAPENKTRDEAPESSHRVDKVLVVQALGPTPTTSCRGESSVCASLDDLRA
jgi:hypothetical protein